MQGADAKRTRESTVPHLSIREMSRKLGMSHRYVMDMEEGIRPWAGDNLARYMKVITDWKKNPTPTPRKPRTVKPKRRRAFAHAAT